MFPNLKRSLKRFIIFILILGLISTAVMTFINLGGAKLFDQSTEKVLIDTDCGNDIDDMFALTRAILAPELDIKAITGTHWSFHPEAGDSSLEVTMREVNQLLSMIKRTDIPLYAGAARRLNYRDKPVPVKSDAANAIIRTAHSMKKGDKLCVITLGSFTNIASAILIDSTIIPKLKVYSMGFQYNPKSRVWNKNEFNVRNDLDAADILLNSLSLEMHILPVNAASEYAFNKAEVSKQFKSRGGVWDFILNKWAQKFPGEDQKTMWDLALVQAVINADLAREEPALTPPENTPRQVYAYSRINNELMEADFWATVYKAWRNKD